MNFLEKLDSLLKEKKLNKHLLSKESGIPYTTIDGWYKKGYDGLKLTTLRKLALFFNTTLDYWAYDDIEKNIPLNTVKEETYIISSKDESILSLYNQLDEGDKGEIRGEIKHMLKAKKYSSQNANIDMEIAEEIAPQIPIDINKMSVEELEEEYKKRKLKSALKRTMSNVLNTAADTQNTNIGGNASNQ